MLADIFELLIDMANIPSFDPNRKVYDDGRFRYGIERSGDFTSQPAIMLIELGLGLPSISRRY